MSLYDFMDRAPLAVPPLAAGAGAVLFGAVTGFLSRDAEVAGAAALVGAGFLGFVTGGALVGGGVLSQAGVIDTSDGARAARWGLGYMGASAAVFAGGALWARGALRRQTRRQFRRDVRRLERYSFDWAHRV